MLIHVFQGSDIQKLKNEVNQLTSQVPAPPKFVLQSQSTVGENSLTTSQRVIVTITVAYE